MASSSSQSGRTRTQIEADLGATRDRLAFNLEALIDQVHPNRIKARQVARAKHFVNDKVESAKSLVFNARGDLRTDRLVAVGGALAGLLSFVLIARAVVRRGKRS